MSEPQVIEDILQTKAIPFLRWTGSKKWLVSSCIDDFLPVNYNNYHEPFLGGGAMFFHLNPSKEVYLYDLNDELINVYSQLRDNIENVIKHLRTFANTKDEYYRIRSMKCRADHARAARFIYLNRTSFNGIYRVNPQGNYNVPYGKRTNVDIVTEENLHRVNSILQGVNIKQGEFSKALNNIRANDLVYLDPPYTVAHENNGFIEYNSKLFSWKDQEKLANMIKEIDRRGAYFILSNAAHFSIRKLYQGVGKIKSVSRYSKVGGRNKTRGVFNELIITNVKK
ncbi:MAG: Dam family site-specific DNA-(adenine-N6)-methyltransferase [Bacteroidetes bacterium]|nr:Dam family site-specific DNA-(adenine-N6)-methyltransferase [Bacteroidota bacterium]